jgi:hypothetical protein
MWIKDKRLYDKYPSILYINELRVLTNFLIYGGKRNPYGLFIMQYVHHSSSCGSQATS